MKSMILKSSLAIVLIGSWTAGVLADKKFEIEFKKLYYKPDSKDPKEKALAEAIDKVTTEVDLDDHVIKNSCNICHVKGKAKKMRNEYGQKLSDLLDVKKDKNNVKKIDESIQKVAHMKSSKGPTYGDLIKEGKLPAEQ